MIFFREYSTRKTEKVNSKKKKEKKKFCYLASVQMTEENTSIKTDAFPVEKLPNVASSLSSKPGPLSETIGQGEN